VVAPIGVDDLVTKFTVLDVGTVAYTLREEDAVCVERILALHGSEKKIAILVVDGKIAVLAVLMVFVDQADPRNCEEEFMKLLKERSREIEVSPILKRIPLIAPEGFLVIDFLRTLWGIHRNNLSAGQITFSVVEIPFVPPRKSPLLPTVRTQCRWRNEFLLPIKHGRHLLVEREILFGDFERR